jgi:hypothetical protein
MDWERVRPVRGVWRLAEHICPEVRRETPRTSTESAFATLPPSPQRLQRTSRRDKTVALIVPPKLFTGGEEDRRSLLRSQR